LILKGMYGTAPVCAMASMFAFEVYPLSAETSAS